MRGVARWTAWTALTVALLYGFAVLACALWLRQYLTPDNLSASTGCWGQRDSIQKAARSRQSRDRLVMYVFRASPAAPRWRAPPADPRMVAIQYVYETWWPIAERERLFAEVAPRLRPCRPVILSEG